MIQTSAEPFQRASKETRNLMRMAQKDELLKLYGLYNQGIQGDIWIQKPWCWEVESFDRWWAWKTEFGKTNEQARQEYIQLVEELIQKYED